MAANDSIKQTLIVATSLCLVCSIVVSTAAVLLKPIQQANKDMDKQANILAVVDLLDSNTNIQKQFKETVEARVIDLDSGQYVEHMDAKDYDQRKAVKDPNASVKLSAAQDTANIKRRANHATVYLVKQNNKLQYVVLPIHGYGLWSTLYGFIALQNDFNTVYGISFYEHAETPGLGGEIDNPNWKSLWKGKKLFASYQNKKPALQVIKGRVTRNAASATYQVDGLAGATLTGNGVSNMIEFWFNQQGYRPFLNNMRTQG